MSTIPAQRNINKVLEKETVEEIIEEIFKQALTVRYFNKNNNAVGLYTSIENVEDKNLHSIFKIFHVSKKKASKLIRGDINNTDKEGNESQVLEFIYIVFKNVFTGEKNDKLEELLKINSVDDIKRILQSEVLSKRLANYIITYVELLIQTYIKRKDNPDFYIEKRKYVPVYYNFVDARTDLKEKLEEESYEHLINSKGEILTEEELDELKNQNNELTEYIMENYIDKLTGKQKEYIKNFLKYSNQEKRIINHNNDVLYSSRSAYYFNNRLKIMLEQLLEQDENIKLKNNKYVLV